MSGSGQAGGSGPAGGSGNAGGSGASARGRPRSEAADRAILRALVVKGVPMGLQVAVMSASMIAMISLVNGYGSRTTAAYGVCFQLWNYIQMPALSVGGAVSSMAAQNIGAKRWDRVGRITGAGILLNVLMTSVLVIAITLVNRPVFTLFLGSGSGAVDLAMHIHRIVSWSFILFGISVVLSGVVRSTGAVLPPLAILFTSLWLVRIPFAVALGSVWHADAIWWSFPVGSVASIAMSATYYRFGRWREAQMLEKGPVGRAVRPLPDAAHASSEGGAEII